MSAATGSADSSSSGTSTKRRRTAALRVREARDRLTSSSGTRPAFDYELLRIFAQTRLSGSLVVLLLVGTIDSFWTGALRAGTWTSAVLMIHAVIITKCRQFLAASPNALNVTAWRFRFVLLDLFFGMSWTFILIHPLGVEEESGTFMLFVMLLVVALASMLASSVPMAVVAAIVPVTAAVALDLALRGNLHHYVLAILTLVAEGSRCLCIGSITRPWQRSRHVRKRTPLSESLRPRRRSPTRRATGPRPRTWRNRVFSHR